MTNAPVVFQRAMTALVSILVPLVVGALIQGHLACGVSTNLLALSAVRNYLADGSDGPGNETLIQTSSACPEAAFVAASRLLSLGRVQEALDFWQSHEAVSPRPTTAFPGYFQAGMVARRAAQAGDWEQALTGYRQMFWEVALAEEGPSLHDVEDEYRQALLSWYASRAGRLNAQEQLRWALWLWRAGDSSAALQVLECALAASPRPEVRSRLQAYRLLVVADGLEVAGQPQQAARTLAQIPPAETAAFVRALLHMARLEEQEPAVGPFFDWREPLADWQPAIPLDYAPSSWTGRLVGAELLEPELVADGGEVCVVLFWRSDVDGAPPTAGSGWYKVRPGQFVQPVCARNLVQDPGFEWPQTGGQSGNVSMLSDWYRSRNPGHTVVSDWYEDGYYEDTGNAPVRQMASPTGAPSHVFCLINPQEGKHRSGIRQLVARVKPTDRFLIAARMNGMGGSNGKLMGYWQWLVDPKLKLFYASRIEQTNEWIWSSTILVPPMEALAAQVYVVNYDAVGTVCVDDIMMLRLNLP